MNSTATPETDWAQFCTVVDATGLLSHRCTASHWQIKGGTVHDIVNCWPNTKKGFRFRADGCETRSGSVADALDLAGPKPITNVRTLAVNEPVDRPVGFLRWLLRKIW